MKLGFILNDNETSLFILFGIIIVTFLIIDLGVLNREAKKISTESALYQTIFWIVISVAFGFVIYFYDGGSEPMFEYFSAYITEKALSVDNIFVIILILNYFKVEEQYYHKILFWGILGAIVFRAVFIFAGVFLVSKLHWVLYIFGAFLVYSGIKLFFEDGEEDFEPEKSPVVRLSRKYLKITKSHFGGKFIVSSPKGFLFTPLFMVLILIETTDLIFAVDSIPAAFAITKSEFILYTSNIFAVLGLRAMFFLLAGILNRFYLLQKGLAFVLSFIGVKMLLEMFSLHIPIYVSFAVILGTITFSILFSVFRPKPEVE
ncbi:TerC/Alx family metal homeostasis membrane protein [Fulvivirgaceae bacterium BMA10]|uniref:TerC/Alx family metal homeostasis membrane protein n=1 Tax=Splendidivirga corallicola TaxID=3051826 RepID=A0ABT8KUG3_9BACT|nr:TerC/Alx family metal homeostasis membrane protein [Fulvivirgaceae bacterium BMA10]